MNASEFVYVLHTNEEIEALISRLMEPLHREIKIVASISDLLAQTEGDPIGGYPRCLITQFEYPGNLTLPAELQRRHLLLPTIYCGTPSCNSDIVTVMRNGAFDVIDVQATATMMASVISQAINHFKATAESERRRFETRNKLELLTPREHFVLDGILRGLMNKSMSSLLGVSIRTVEQRRRNIFKKVGVSHPAQLTQLFLDATNTPIETTLVDDELPLRKNFFDLNSGTPPHSFPH